MHVWKRHNQISLAAGSHPSKADGTRTEFPISSLGDQKQWSAALEEQNPHFWTISVSTPANAPVGQYALLLHASKTDCLLGNFTLLFNPWCRGMWSETGRLGSVTSQKQLLSSGTLPPWRLRWTQLAIPATPALLLTMP